MKGLTIVNPLVLTDSMVTSDVPEDDYAEWDESTTYVLGDRVISTDTHMVYESVRQPSTALINAISTTAIVLEAASSELVEGMPVQFFSSGTLPTGVSAGTTYYAHLLQGLQIFSVSATPGGSAISMTGGSGPWFVTLGVNVGRDPTDADNVGTYWAEVQPTNAWSAFDGRTSSQTAKATSMFFEITPGIAIGAVYAGNVIGATSMRVIVTDPDPAYGVAYDQTFDFTALPSESSWWTWLFGVRSAPRSKVVFDLPSLPNAVIRVEFAGGADLAVGVLLVGQPTTFGAEFGTQQGASAGITDYSRRETDDFGNTNLVRRAYAPKARMRVMLPNREVAAIQNYLADMRATPALFVGDPLLEPLVVFGFYKNFDITLAYAQHSECDLEIEGLP